MPEEPGPWVLCSDGFCAPTSPRVLPLKTGRCLSQTSALVHAVTWLGAVGAVSAPPPYTAGKQDLSAALSAAVSALPGITPGMDCPAWASGAATSCGEPGALEPGHFWSVLAEDWAALQDTPGLPLDPDHHVAGEIGNVLVLHAEMVNDRKIVFSFLMWVKCGA